MSLGHRSAGSLSGSRKGWARWCIRSALMLLITASIMPLSGFGMAVQHGLDQPELHGWCRLHWYGGCATGIAGLTHQGLLLDAAQSPPPSGFEISLNRLQQSDLLLLLSSPNRGGSVRILLDGEVIERVQVPSSGRWWVRLTELPGRGILRLELDTHVEQLTVREARIPCPECPGSFHEVPDERIRYMLLGVLAGLAGAVLLSLLLD